MEAPVSSLRRWTRAEFARMVETGIIQADERVELLDGEVVAMTPQKGPHATVVDVLHSLLKDALGRGFRVRSQLPLALGPTSEPEPDLAIVKGGPWDFLVDHPTGAELVIEVAESTLGKDRLRKGPLYARAGIQEYWIVDLTSDAVEVCRDPGDDGYRSVERLVRGQTIRPLAKPDIIVAVADILPPV
jgi:Uma2 family endonuclease